MPWLNAVGIARTEISLGAVVGGVQRAQDDVPDVRGLTGLRHAAAFAGGSRAAPGTPTRHSRRPLIRTPLHRLWGAGRQRSATMIAEMKSTGPRPILTTLRPCTLYTRPPTRGDRPCCRHLW
jgi:hypothetical protein